MKSFKWQVLQWLLAFSGSLLLALLQLPPPCGAVRDCQRIEIKHGAVHRKHKGRVLEFKCDPGFWLQGTERIFCTSDGVVKRGYQIPKCRPPAHGVPRGRKNSHEPRQKFNFHRHNSEQYQKWPKAGFIFCTGVKEKSNETFQNHFSFLDPVIQKCSNLTYIINFVKHHSLGM